MTGIEESARRAIWPGRASGGYLPDLVANADRVEQAAGLHGCPPEAGLGMVRRAGHHGRALAQASRVPPSLSRQCTE